MAIGTASFAVLAKLDRGDELDDEDKFVLRTLIATKHVKTSFSVTEKGRGALAKGPPKPSRFRSAVDFDVDGLNKDFFQSRTTKPSWS